MVTFSFSVVFLAIVVPYLMWRYLNKKKFFRKQEILRASILFLIAIVYEIFLILVFMELELVTKMSELMTWL